MAMTDAQFARLLNRMPRATDKPCPTFSSGDAAGWLDFRKRFENIARNNGWQADTQRAQLGMALEGAAARMISGIDLDAQVVQQDQVDVFKRNHGGALPDPLPTAVRTPAECLNAYEAIFLPKSAGRMAEQQLAEARQSSNESALEWGARLREIYARARPGTDIQDSREAISAFIKGTYSTSIKAKLFDADPETFDKAVTKATDKEATALLCRRASAAGAQGLHQMGLNGISDDEAEDGPGIGAKRRTLCWNCGKGGHFRRNCPQPDRRDEAGGGERGARGGKGGRGRRRQGQGRRRLPPRGSKGRFTSHQVSSLADALGEILGIEADGEGPGDDAAASGN